MTTIEMGEFQFGRGFSNAFGSLRQDFGALLPSIFLYVLGPQFAVGLLHLTVLPVDPANPFGAMLGVIGENILANLISLAAVGSVIAVVGGRLAGAPLSAQSAISVGIRKFLPIWGVSIARTFAVAIASFIILAPGLFLFTMWYVAVPALVLEDEDVFGSLSRSAELTKGHRWPVFGYLLLAAVMIFLPPFILGAVSIFLPGAIDELIVTPLVQTLTVVLAPSLSTGLFHELKRVREGGGTQVANIFA
ncbi:MAG: hypothetical protein WCI21_03995 [Alphaproteobacteria bacterium]